MPDVLPDDQDPLTDQTRSSVLEDEDGEAFVVDQQNVGPRAEGGGEWPDPASPPQSPAPGSAEPAS